MVKIQLLASEALKKVYDGTFIEGGNIGHHVWAHEDNPYDGVGDPLDFKWYVGIIGALFLAAINEDTRYLFNNSAPNFWSNEFVEHYLQDSSNYFDLRGKTIRRYKSLYNLNDDMLDYADNLIKKECKIKTKFLLEEILGINKELINFRIFY